MPAPAAAIETREAVLKRIKWERPGNTWKLLQMSNGQTWKGQVGDVLPGALLTAKGVEVTDNFGLAFEVQDLVSAVLKGAAGIESWLTYRLPDVGEVRARALVERFGEGLGDVILNSPADLATVPGITAERALDIQKAYLSYQDELAWVPKLVDLGFRMDQALAAFKAHGTGLAAVLDEDPYELCDVEGLSFEAVDAVARRLGMAEKDPRRVRAWVRAQLEDDLDEGHCHRPLLDVVLALVKWGFPAREVIELLKPSRHLWIEKDAVSLSRIAYAERQVAAGVRALIARGKRELGEVELPESLDASQREAALALLVEPVVVMTGGPGVGKTHTLKSVLDVIEARGERAVLAAPTGKAAKRMSEVTGRPASTLHKLIGWTPTGWKCGPDAPIAADVVVADEFSMCDVELAASLLDAIGEGTRLILVGDVDQLPPVGPGQPLVDIIRSEQVPVHRLTTTHRQSAKSWVIDNARRIIEGEVPNLESEDSFDFLECGTSEAIVEVVVALQKAFPNVQVLTPEHKKGAGTVRLNNEIQAAVNPRCKDRFASFIESNGCRIYAGDRVIYTRNQLGLVNGDIGVVEDVEVMGNKRTVTVRFVGVEHPEIGDGIFELEDGNVRPLQLAYAMTVHKCVAPDTLVWTTRGMLEFEELVEDQQRSSSEIATGEGLCKYEKPFMLKGTRKCVRIKTRSGYEVTVTTDHKMMAWTGEKYESVNASDLQKGQFLRLALDEGAHIGKMQVLLVPSEEHDVRAVYYKTPPVLTAEVAEFLGLMVADGTVYDRGFRLVKGYRDVVERFSVLCNKLFGTEPPILEQKNKFASEVNSVFLVSWLRQIGGMGPRAKAIPKAVLFSGEVEQAAFLRGLFEDGTVNVREDRMLDHVEWGSSSSRMVQQVQIMLLRFGIISSRTERTVGENEYFALYIYGQSAKRFAEAIGFVSRLKNERLKADVGAERRYKVPISWAEAAAFPDQSARQNTRTTGYASRATVRDLGVYTERLRFHHEQIVKMEVVQSRAGCLVVPECGRFLQNGFDGCNSQGSEFAEVVVVADEAHWSFCRQLLYTAVTRTSDKLGIVGSREAVARAVAKPRDTNRRTRLVERIGGGT